MTQTPNTPTARDTLSVGATRGAGLPAPEALET